MDTNEARSELLDILNSIFEKFTEEDINLIEDTMNYDFLKEDIIEEIIGDEIGRLEGLVDELEDSSGPSQRIAFSQLQEDIKEIQDSIPDGFISEVLSQIDELKLKIKKNKSDSELSQGETLELIQSKVLKYTNEFDKLEEMLLDKIYEKHSNINLDKFVEEYSQNKNINEYWGGNKICRCEEVEEYYNYIKQEMRFENKFSLCHQGKHTRSTPQELEDAKQKLINMKEKYKTV